MPTSVAIRAEEVALCGFSGQPFPGSAEIPETERLGLRIAMVEFQRGNADVISAVLAPAASDFDETPLPFDSPPPLTAV